MRWRDEQPQRLPRAEAGDLCGHDHHAHPKLRTGSFFPDDIVERYQRVDRAFVAAMAVMYATGASTRKVARVAETFPSVESLEHLAGAVMCDEDEEWLRALLLRGKDGVAARGRRGRRRAEVRRGAEAGRGTHHHVEPGACGHAIDGVGWRCDSAVGPPSRRDSYTNFPDATLRRDTVTNSPCPTRFSLPQAFQHAFSSPVPT